MRHTSAAAALLAAALTGGVAVTPSAHAQSGPEARYAWVKSCQKKDDSTYPCGHWRLVTRDGATIEVPGAQVVETDEGGHRTGDSAPFAISGDGAHIAYVRESDLRIMVRRTAGGPARALPRSVLPPGFGTADIALRLSPAGDRVLVDYDMDDGSERSKIVTVATGKVGKLPGADHPLGFSADGDEVLTSRYNDDNTYSLVSTGLDGSVIEHVPPQVVANAVQFALAADGRTLAVFVGGDEARRKPPRLRIFDLVSGELSAGVDLALKPKQTPSLARWDGEDRLTVQVVSGGDGAPTVVRVLTVDSESGAIGNKGSYKVGKNNYSWFAAGE